MADLPPDLQLPRDLGDAATPPPFGALARRATIRRRRRTAGAAAAVVVAIAALASGIGVVTTHRSAGPPPANTPHRHRSQVAIDPQALPIIEHGRLVDYAVDSRGDTLTLWLHGSHQAWALTTSPQSSMIAPNIDGVVAHPRRHYAGLVSSGGYRPYRVTATRIGFVVTSEAGYPFVISRHGVVASFERTTAGTAAPGDVVFDEGYGTVQPAIADLATRTWWVAPPAAPPGSPIASDSIGVASTTVGADGSYWLWASRHGHSLTLLQRPCTIKEYPPTSCTWPVTSSVKQGTVPGAFVALGHRFAAFTTFGGATVYPVGRWVVGLSPASPPGVFPKSQVPFGDVESMATTRSGILLVADAAGRLWADDTGLPDGTWANFYRVPIGHRVTMLQQGLDGAVFAEVDTSHPGQPQLLRFDERTDHTLHAAPWLWGSLWTGPES